MLKMQLRNGAGKPFLSRSKRTVALVPDSSAVAQLSSSGCQVAGGALPIWFRVAC